MISWKGSGYLSSSLEDALKLALEMEKKSYAFYMMAADKSHNGVVEAVLRSLALDEESHINIIERFYSALEKTHQWPTVNFKNLDTRSGSERFNQIVSKSSMELTPDSSYAEVYEFARDKEMNARDFYREQQELNKSQNELYKFFSFLGNMENVHMNMLDLLVQGTRAVTENK